MIRKSIASGYDELLSGARLDLFLAVDIRGKLLDNDLVETVKKIEDSTVEINIGSVVQAILDFIIRKPGDPVPDGVEGQRILLLHPESAGFGELSSVFLSMDVVMRKLPSSLDPLDLGSFIPALKLLTEGGFDHCCVVLDSRRILEHLGNGISAELIFNAIFLSLSGELINFLGFQISN